MDIKRIEKVMKLMETYDVGNFDYEDEQISLKLRKGTGPFEISTNQHTNQHSTNQLSTGYSGGATEKNHESLASAPAVKKNDNLTEVKSPFVGTFYRAPSPTSDSYVEIGSRVKKGDVLCIVEAMKLMNEIESEVDGVVRDISMENGSPVEYGSELFIIERGC